MARDEVQPSDEKERVNWLATAMARGAPVKAVADGVNVLAGASAGDDCAVIAWDTKRQLVVGTDYVRGPRFRLFELGFLDYGDVARFCVTANISDIAAMGASPVGFLAVVRYPKDLADQDFRQIMRAIDAACHHYGCALLGGDTGSAERVILSGTALGVAGPHGALLRSSAYPGDVVAVTAPVGGAGAAVLAADAGVQDRLPADVWNSLLGCWTGYTAQPRAGACLAEAGRVACQDVSDGLLSTLRELAAASGVSVVLDPAEIPWHPGVAAVADLLSVDPVSLGVSASTDFCLAFTCDVTAFPAVAGALSLRGVRARRIGHVEPGGGVWFRGPHGNLVPVRGAEWRHQGDAVSDVIRAGLAPEREPAGPLVTVGPDRPKAS